jgi:hypothetical protein
MVTMAVVACFILFCVYGLVLDLRMGDDEVLAQRKASARRWGMEWVDVEIRGRDK